jgi:hypothetical protein
MRISPFQNKELHIYGMYQSNSLTGPDPEDQYPEKFAEILPLATGCDSSALFAYPITTSPSGYQNSTDPGPFRVIMNFVSEEDVRYAISLIILYLKFEYS